MRINHKKPRKKSDFLSVISVERPGGGGRGVKTQTCVSLVNRL